MTNARSVSVIILRDQRKEKREVWKYAVILFTSAFVVLLLTAYSQIKLNKSIGEYESKIQGEIKEKYVYQYDLRKALQESKKLNEEISAMKKRVTELENKNSIIIKEVQAAENKLEEAAKFYIVLSEAEEEYKKGNLVKCAQLLNTVLDKNLLGTQAKERYDYLYGKTYYKAGLNLYAQGYSLYTKEKYIQAADSFIASYALTRKEYYSDDCLYFAAYSFYYSGKHSRSEERRVGK